MQGKGQRWGVIVKGAQKRLGSKAGPHGVREAKVTMAPGAAAGGRRAGASMHRGPLGARGRDAQGEGEEVDAFEAWRRSAGAVKARGGAGGVHACAAR